MSYVKSIIEILSESDLNIFALIIFKNTYYNTSTIYIHTLFIQSIHIVSDILWF